MVPAPAQQLTLRRQILDSLLKNLAVDYWRCRLSSPSDGCTAREALATLADRAFTGHMASSSLAVKSRLTMLFAEGRGVSPVETEVGTAHSGKPGLRVNPDMVCEPGLLEK